MATKPKKSAEKSVTLFNDTPKPVAPVADWRTVAGERVVHAKKSLAVMPTGGGNWLSFRDTGKFVIGNEERGSELDIVILEHATEFSYFDAPYVEGQKSAAACYSLDNENPHPEAPRKQDGGKGCAHCPHMQMGSDERGRGRACKVKGRIAFIMADEVRDIDSIMAAPIYFATPSTLNSIPMRSYLLANDREDSPIFAKRTHISISPGGKAKYSLKWERTATIDHEDALRALAARNVEARAEMAKARPVFESENNAPATDRKSAARKRKF